MPKRNWQQALTFSVVCSAATSTACVCSLHAWARRSESVGRRIGEGSSDQEQSTACSGGDALLTASVIASLGPIEAVHQVSIPHRQPRIEACIIIQFERQAVQSASSCPDTFAFCLLTFGLQAGHCTLWFDLQLWSPPLSALLDAARRLSWSPVISWRFVQWY